MSHLSAMMDQSLDHRGSGREGGGSIPHALDLEATMHSSQLLWHEVERHVAKHRRQLASATKTIEEISAKRIEEQAMAAAEKAATSVAQRLKAQAESLRGREEEFQWAQRDERAQMASIQEEQAALLKQERADVEKLLEEGLAALEAKRQEGQAALKREWGHVDLTNEVASVYLKKTEEAVVAEKAAAEAEAASTARMGIALEMQQQTMVESEAQTQAALHLHSQAGKAKWEAEAEKAAAEEERSAMGASVERVQELEAEVLELKAEVGRLQGVASEAERRTVLAEQIIAMQLQQQGGGGGGGGWAAPVLTAQPPQRPPAALAPAAVPVTAQPADAAGAVPAALPVSTPTPAAPVPAHAPAPAANLDEEDPWAVLQELATQMPPIRSSAPTEQVPTPVSPPTAAVSTTSTPHHTLSTGVSEISLVVIAAAGGGGWEHRGRRQRSFGAARRFGVGLYGFADRCYEDRLLYSAG